MLLSPFTVASYVHQPPCSPTGPGRHMSPSHAALEVSTYYLMWGRKFLESLVLSTTIPFYLWPGIKTIECLRPWCIDGEFHMRYSQNLKNLLMMSCSNTLLSHLNCLCLLLAFLATPKKLRNSENRSCSLDNSWLSAKLTITNPWPWVCTLLTQRQHRTISSKDPSYWTPFLEIQLKPQSPLQKSDLSANQCVQSYQRVFWWSL